MFTFIEKGIREGVSQSSNRYTKTNNKCMGEKFNEEAQTSYTLYTMLIIYMVRQCLPLYPLADLNGLIRVR